MEKFRYSQPKKGNSYVLPVRFPEKTYKRLLLAVESVKTKQTQIFVNMPNAKAKTKNGVTRQEMIRQMVLHCLNDMGV